MANQPIGASCDIYYKDDPETVFGAYISLTEGYDEDNGTDEFGVDDDEIFFYTDGESGLKSLMDAEGSSEFVVVSYELAYP
jgi:hypothetical protein